MFGLSAEQIFLAGSLASVLALFIVTAAFLINIREMRKQSQEFARKCKSLEQHLLKELTSSKGQERGQQGQRSINHIVRHVGLTPEEIIRVSYTSGKIKRVGNTDGDGPFMDHVLFVYESP